MIELNRNQILASDARNVEHAISHFGKEAAATVLNALLGNLNGRVVLHRWNALLSP